MTAIETYVPLREPTKWPTRYLDYGTVAARDDVATGASVLGTFNAAYTAPQQSGQVVPLHENWLSRLNQIKAEIAYLADVEGVALPESALRKMDYLVVALAGSLEPAFEVDPADGEIAILWNDAARRHSVALRIDGSDDVRVVAYRHGAAQQPDSHTIEVRSRFDAVAVRLALRGEGYKEVVIG